MTVSRDADRQRRPPKSVIPLCVGFGVRGLGGFAAGLERGAGFDGRCAAGAGGLGTTAASGLTAPPSTASAAGLDAAGDGVSTTGVGSGGAAAATGGGGALGTAGLAAFGGSPRPSHKKLAPAVARSNPPASATNWCVRRRRCACWLARVAFCPHEACVFSAVTLPDPSATPAASADILPEPATASPDSAVTSPDGMVA